MEQIDTLIKQLLEGETYSICYEAADALKAYKEPRVVMALIQAMGMNIPDDEEARVNRHAAGALARIGVSAKPALLKALEEKTDDWYVYWIVEALRGLRDLEVIPALERKRQAWRGAKYVREEIDDAIRFIRTKNGQDS